MHKLTKALLLIALLATMMGLDWINREYIHGLPTVPTYTKWSSQVPKLSRVYSADGKIIARFYVQKRTIITPGNIPAHLKAAVLAAEDADFFNHGPISPLSVLRALMIDMISGRVMQGGSTISQQTAKVLFLTQERTMHRKFRELILAYMLERRMTKQEILSVYMSSVYLGRGNTGFEEAARFYLHKGARDLNFAEAALLAGMISSPEKNNPVTNQAGTRKRQLTVLKRMLNKGFIDKKTYEKAVADHPVIYHEPLETMGTAPYFAEQVRRQMHLILGRHRMQTQGLRIYTTINTRIQNYANWIEVLGLARLMTRGRHRNTDELVNHTVAGNAKIIKCDRKQGFWKVKTDKKGLVVRVPFEWAPRLFFPGRDPCSIRGRIRIHGVLRRDDNTRTAVPVFGPQAAIVVIDPSDFSVLAMVGGESFYASRFNRAINAIRPVGSVVKPFIYAVALDTGKVLPGQTFPNTPLALRAGHGRWWRPSNYEGFDNKDYTLEQAIAHSINVIAVRVLRRVGITAVAEFFTRLGLRARVPHNLSLALGSLETSPMEIAGAMGIFAHNGKYDRPFMIRQVMTFDGRILFRHRPAPRQVIKKWVARTVRGYMRAVATYGTGRSLAAIKDAWGKTGTTNRSREVWFAGGCKGLTAAIYVGYDDRLPMRRATGANTALPFFKALCELMNKTR